MRNILLLVLLLSTSLTFSQGYQYLGSYTSNGTPQYFAQSDVVNSETMTLINNALPENYPVPTYNPHYISAGYETDLLLDAEADVWVTFISEGAGYKNVMGFYTYDLNNPPTVAPTNSEITIIFPNASALNSGGSLQAGHKVKIGTFPAGTGIGWVLIANGWNGSQVTNGYWKIFSNRNFNPATNPNLKAQTVLLHDTASQRYFVGFEDIRRDSSSCDQDFNDLIVYFTASPNSAVRASNIVDIQSATDVTSGNNGGLESEGSLAKLIAKRNFLRAKNNEYNDRKELQKSFKNSAAKSNNALEPYFPTLGMFGDEITNVSTPADLVQITNATNVLSVDYYKNNNRVAAALATETVNNVYNHSKVICDRLNNSQLEDVRTIELRGHKIIMSKLRRASGEIEYALSFSVLEELNNITIHSFWNIEQYPAGNYKNFQLWGSSMGQVCHIADYIIKKFEENKTVLESNIQNRIPSLFIKNGKYKNGKLRLILINKNQSTAFNFNGNYKTTELDQATAYNTEVSISKNLESVIEIPIEQIFEIGFSIKGDKSQISDALYLADGPWGLDYLNNEANVTNFQINNPILTNESDVYQIERNVNLSANVKSNLNLFRNILPGELLFEATDFDGISFFAKNNKAVEVVIVTENITDWNKRLKFTLEPNNHLNQITIPFSNFVSNNGGSYQNQKIRGIVYSMIGDGQNFQKFDVQINDLKFQSNTTLGISNNDIDMKAIYNYPNPFSNRTTIAINDDATSGYLKLIDMNGRIIQQEKVNIDNRNIHFTTNAGKGIYFIEVTTESRRLTTKCIIN